MGTPLPSGAGDWSLRTPLMPHQREALAKLLPARVGALFAEMGTGKTLMAIALVWFRRAKIDRVLWFGPVSSKETIRREILKHTDCTEADIQVFDDKTNEANARGCFWTLVGTESVSGSARVYCTALSLVTERALVVVDESHQIKGHRSRRTERLTYLARPARYRLILTGTPISQGIVDLFAQMRFLSPDILGYRSYWTFANNHLVYSERFKGLIEGEKNKAYLAARIKPYVYQIAKDECLSLPAKLYGSRYFRLTEDQQDAYAEAKERLLTEDYLLGDDWQRRIAVFTLFTVLQGIVCGFETQPDGSLREIPHALLDLLQTVLSEIPAGAPVVIWAKYRYALAQITAALTAVHGPEAVQQYHGGLSERARQAQLDTWRRGGRYLVATQSAGGQSIDLTHASHVVYYANSFKYAERQQSEDRCHRIGQARPVTYIDLWSNAGIDARIDKALSRKGNAVAAFRDEVERIRKTDKQRLHDLVAQL